MSTLPESTAAAIFVAAVKAGRAAELLDVLFRGGTATVNQRGQLIIVQPHALEHLRRRT